MKEGNSTKRATALSERLIAGVVVAFITAILAIPTAWIHSRCSIDNRFDGIKPSNPMYQVLEVFCPLPNKPTELVPRATPTRDVDADAAASQLAGGGWAVQISTDWNVEGACWEVSQAEKENYKARAYKINETTYVTLVGDYRSKEEAEALVGQIKLQLTKSSAWAVRIPSHEPITCP